MMVVLKCLNKNIIMYKIGDKVKLTGNPLDEQLGEFIPIGIKTIVEVKDVMEFKRTSGQWVKIKEYNGWIDADWFEKV